VTTQLFLGLCSIGVNQNGPIVEKVRQKRAQNTNSIKKKILLLKAAKTGIVNIHVRSEILLPQRDMYTSFNMF